MEELNKKEEVNITYFASVESKEIKWLWKPYIAFGKLTILEGDPGDGKTTLALKLVSELTSLQSREIDGLAPRKINIIYQSAEDGVEDTIKIKLERMHADCRRIAFIDNNDLSLEDDSIEKAIIKTKAELMVFDPIQSFIGKDKSLNSVKSIRSTFRKLATIASKTGCAILLIGHLTKAEGKKTLYRGLGSIDITAIARSVLYLKRSDYDKNIRVISQIKNSLDREGVNVAYESDKSNNIRWLGEYTEEFGEPLIKVENKKASSPKLARAKEIIKYYLDKNVNGARFIISKCKEEGISSGTVKFARYELGVKSIKQGRNYMWSYE